MVPRHTMLVVFAGILLSMSLACSDDTSRSENDDTFNVGEADAGSDVGEGESDAATDPTLDAEAPPEDTGPPPVEDTGTDDAAATDTGETDTGEPDSGEEPPPDFDPYELGEFDVTTDDVDVGPTESIVFSPEQSGTYPLVVFQHGFVMYNTHYSQLLTHVASHGFVVVAPQMYDTGGLPFGTPSTEEEAQLANEFYDWLDDELDAHVDVDVDTNRLGLAGHSRGSKAIWWALDEQPRSVDAFAGVDPVDGTGGPLGDEPQVTDDPVDIDAPVILIGAGLGSESAGFGQPACAPEGENYEEFYAASASPAWQIVAPDYGHMDMLDDNPDGCGMECDACVDGDSRAPMRQLTGGLLVALFTGALHDEPPAFDWLDDEVSAPVDVAIDSK